MRGKAWRRALCRERKRNDHQKVEVNAKIFYASGVRKAIMALIGVARANKGGNRRSLPRSNISYLNTMRHLERKRFRVTYLRLTRQEKSA